MKKLVHVMYTLCIDCVYQLLIKTLFNRNMTKKANKDY